MVHVLLGLLRVALKVTDVTGPRDFRLRFRKAAIRLEQRQHLLG